MRILVFAICVFSCSCCAVRLAIPTIGRTVTLEILNDPQLRISAIIDDSEMWFADTSYALRGKIVIRNITDDTIQYGNNYLFLEIEGGETRHTNKNTLVCEAIDCCTIDIPPWDSLEVKVYWVFSTKPPFLPTSLILDRAGLTKRTVLNTIK